MADDTYPREDEDRRPIIAIILLLLLTPGFLCFSAQLALRGVTPGEVNADIRSLLDPDYSADDRVSIAPVDPTAVGTIRAEQATSVAPTERGDGDVVVSTLENTQVAEATVTGEGPTLTPSRTPRITSTASNTPSATDTTTATNTLTPTNTLRPTNTFIGPTFTFTPTFTATFTLTFTPTFTATVTLTPTASLTASITPSPTNTLTPTLTLTPTNTLTPSPTLTPSVTPSPTFTPTNTPLPTNRIAGQLFEDPNHSGDGLSGQRACPAALQGVTMALLDGGSTVATTATLSDCTYLFVPPGNGTYRVQANLGACGIPCLEQVMESDGTTTNTGAGALGGDSPAADNDHGVSVTYAGGALNGVDLGFSYEVVTNTTDGGRGSLRQAMLNANNIGGGQNIRFAGIFAPYTITPGAPLPPLNDAGTNISGSGKSVTINGGAAGGTAGFTVNGSGTTLSGMAIQGFSGAGVAVSGAQNVFVSSNTITGNGGAGVLVTGGTANVTIRFNSMQNNGGLGIDLLGDGVTSNDGNADADAGPNALVNYPNRLGTGSCPGNQRFLLGAQAVGGTADIYLSSDDASGHGEGVTYRTSVTDGGASDLDGAANGEVCLDTTALSISGLLATLTTVDANGNTSEFGPTITLP